MNPEDRFRGILVWSNSPTQDHPRGGREKVKVEVEVEPEGREFRIRIVECGSMSLGL